VKKSSQKICATSVIAKTLPNVNNCPMGGNFAQSGRPGLHTRSKVCMSTCQVFTKNFVGCAIGKTVELAEMRPVFLLEVRN
jgi:hypothetical protein